MGSCETSRADCNGVATDGCEASTSAVTSCGGCGITCKAGDVCSEGACATTCSVGKTSCGGACVDTTRDPLHCGGCGKACTPPKNGLAACSAAACGVSCPPGTTLEASGCIAPTCTFSKVQKGTLVVGTTSGGVLEVAGQNADAQQSAVLDLDVGSGEFRVRVDVSQLTHKVDLVGFTSGSASARLGIRCGGSTWDSGPTVMSSVSGQPVNHKIRVAGVPLDAAEAISTPLLDPSASAPPAVLELARAAGVVTGRVLQGGSVVVSRSFACAGVSTVHLSAFGSRFTTGLDNLVVEGVCRDTFATPRSL